MKILILVIMLSMTSCEKQDAQADTTPTKTEKVTPVKTIKVTPGSFTAFEEFFGKVLASEEMDMISHNGGTVKAIHVRSGDLVKKGQKLCDIEGEKYSTLLEMNKLSERVALDSLNRLKAHLQSGRSSQLNVDNANLNYLKAKQERINAEKTYEGAFCVAEFSGVVTSISMERFQNLLPGAQTVSIANLDKLKVELEIPESSIFETKRGSRAEIKMPNDENWIQATISSLDQRIDYKSKKFKAEIMLPEIKSSLKPGMTVKVKVQSYDIHDQLVIPSNAVLTLAHGLAVVVVEENLAKRIPIEILATNGKETVVKSGLKLGDQLVISGQDQAAEGSPVKVVESAKEEGKS